MSRELSRGRARLPRGLVACPVPRGSSGGLGARWTCHANSACHAAWEKKARRDECGGKGGLKEPHATALETSRLPPRVGSSAEPARLATLPASLSGFLHQLQSNPSVERPAGTPQQAFRARHARLLHAWARAHRRRLAPPEPRAPRPPLLLLGTGQATRPRGSLARPRSSRGLFRGPGPRAASGLERGGQRPAEPPGPRPEARRIGAEGRERGAAEGGAFDNWWTGS